ncbi:hypothetical protein K474DRAFT_32293 [Panus rudis PR-1116 ss-1]|nr:hypothetical protein K474DRAFT_32293 [Panus rudis PR-1116 ss-1]
MAPNPRRRRRSPGSTQNDQDATPVPGRREISRKRTRRSLSRLPEMPCDILFEIFGHLQPLDLLRLARSTKSFRNLLMSRTSAFIWKEARNNVEHDFPECPEDMSEPRYASFVFENFCEHCPARVPVPDFYNRNRCCEECVGSGVYAPAYCFTSRHSPISVQDWEITLRDLPITLNIDEMLHSLGTVRIERVKELLKEIRDKKTDEKALRDLEQRMLERSAAIHSHTRSLRAWWDRRKQHRSDENDKRRRQRFDQIIERLKEHDGSLYEEFTILDTSALFHLEEQPWMKKTTMLTDHGWRSIQEKVVQYFKDVRTDRLVMQEATLIRERIQLLKPIVYKYEWDQPLGAIVPSVADIAYLPPVRAILTLPSGAPLVQEKINSLARHMGDLADGWKRNMIELICRRTIAKTGESIPVIDAFLCASESEDFLTGINIDETTISPLSALLKYCLECVSAWLEGSGCFYTCSVPNGSKFAPCGTTPCVLTFPRVLVHRCLREHDAESYKGFEHRALLTALELESEQRPVEVGARGLEFQHFLTCNIGRALHGYGQWNRGPGLPAIDARRSYVWNECDLRFACKHCLTLSASQRGMDWRQAAEHMLSHPACMEHFQLSTEALFETLSGDLAREVKDLEARRIARGDRKRHVDPLAYSGEFACIAYACAYCRSQRRAESLYGIKNHLKLVCVSFFDVC